MPAALQVVNVFKQGLTGGTFEALTFGTGDSATFQTFAIGQPAWLANVYGVDDASPCEFSLIASNFHDQIEGIAGWVPDGSTLAPVNRPTSLTPPGLDQPIFPADVLTVQVNGTAKDNVNGTLLLYYSDLPNLSGTFRSAAAVKAATINLVGVDVAQDASTGASQGDWSTAVSITAAARRLNASKYYAIVGYTSDVPCSAVGISAFETGNLKIGGPALADGGHDSNFIYNLAQVYGTPLIPVFPGSNQDNVLVYVADPVATTVNLTVMLAELSGPI